MYEYKDEELGRVIVKANARAKRAIARRHSDYIQLTVPYGFNPKDIPWVLEKLRPRLLKAVIPKEIAITEDTVIESLTFRATLSRSHLIENVRMKLKAEELSIILPADFDLETAASQQLVKELVRHALRIEAKRVLPHKTVMFAKKLNLQVNDVKISKSVSKWGSCSNKKNINLSLYLMLLPEKYINYVILHELAHTIQMNHSAHFWELLSTFCGEDAQQLDKMVSQHTPPSYRLLKENRYSISPNWKIASHS